MPKDTSETFFTEEAKLKTSDTANPDVMSKWVGVAEKGINLIDQLVKMRSAKENVKGGGEASAYEKGMSAGLQQASAQVQVTPQPAQAPAVVQVEPKLIINSEGAEKYLFEALGKTDQTKTLKEYLEGDLKEAQEMGVLKPMIEKFIENFTEIKQ